MPGGGGRWRYIEPKNTPKPNAYVQTNEEQQDQKSHELQFEGRGFPKAGAWLPIQSIDDIDPVRTPIRRRATDFSSSQFPNQTFSESSNMGDMIS